MIVLPARATVRKTAQKPKSYESRSFTAPIRGWVANESIAAMQPGGAVRLDNGFPTQTDVRPRGGARKHATIGSDPVECLFTYVSGGTQTFFAADVAGVFDISAPADAGTPPSASISGQTSGYYSVVPFTTAGGDFLYILNGTDDPQLYDSSSWTAINAGSTPSISNVTSADLIQGCVYRNRLFFVEKNTMNIWYPSVATLGGALSSLTLNGVFKRGGSVQFCATWSLDAGDGVDDKFVVVSTEGEVAVYEGANPSDADDWRLVGVYNISRPLGKNGWLQIGGDLLILTEEGIVPVSEAVKKDPAALSLSAVSRAIEPAWKKAVQRRKFRPWEFLKWSEQNKGIVNVPRLSDADEMVTFVVNVETGAWCRYTGWDTRCLGMFNQWAYFGTNDGTVMQCEIGGNDDGQPYEFTCISGWDHFGTPGATKTVHQGRASFTASSPFLPRLSVSTNYVEAPASTPNSPANYPRDLWDVGLWDVAIWDGTVAPQVSTQWTTIGRTGFVFAWQVQMSFGVDPTPDVALNSVDLVFDVTEVAV